MKYYYRLRNEMNIVDRAQTYNFEEAFSKAARIALEQGNITLLNVSEWGLEISKKMVKVSVTEDEANLDEI